MKRFVTIVSIASFASFVTATAYGHPGHPEHESGLLAGLTHPLLGIDHLLAMVTVGLLAAQIGGRALWALPAAFVGSMLLGGICGVQGWSLPGVEYGIALSIVLFGLAVALNRKIALAAPLAFAGLFGVFHGHAHGVEMPQLANPVLYAVGFIAATIALHAIGVVGGRLAIRSAQGATALRFSGAAIALAGLFFLRV